jgi:RimJ/RimL family protein N-acetyltransferase
MHDSTQPFTPQPVVLDGRHVRLEPIAPGHAPALFAAASDADTWTYMPRGPFDDEADVRTWIRAAQRETEAGAAVVFAVVERGSGAAVGSTRYLDIRPEHRGLEIGWTWLAPRVRRTPVNTECKLLLLEHAFERLGAVRVQLKTDLRNERSQRAIERIGGVREGVLRRDRWTWTGHIRSTVYYSVLAEEWPQVRARLEGLLGARE